MKKIVLIFFMLTYFGIAYSSEKITVFTEEWAPFNYLENDKPAGISVDIAKEMMKITGKGPKGGEISANLKDDVLIQLSNKNERLNISDEGIIIMMEDGEKDIVIKLDDFKRIAASNTIIFDSDTILDIVRKEGMEVPNRDEIDRIMGDRDIIDAAHVSISIMVMEKLEEVVNKDAAK